MSLAQPEDLLNTLKEIGLDDKQILDIFVSILKQQLLYGGSLDDKINYWFGEARKPHFKQSRS
jgi:hypothetical protein